MRIRAAAPEGADRSEVWPAVFCVPGLCRLVDIERAVLPDDVLVLLVTMQAGRDGVVLHPLQQAHDADQTGGCHRMTEVALAARDCARSGSRLAPEDRIQRVDLDRVAQWRARAVRDDVGDVPRVDVMPGVNALDQLRLHSPV